MTLTHRALVWASIVVGMSASYRLGHDNGQREERQRQEIAHARWWSGCLASRARTEQIVLAAEAARVRALEVQAAAPPPPTHITRKAKLGKKTVYLTERIAP